ncbi:hypothetical protein PM082_024347 [Marasmius tenuissimus]|nr:hypothetical protein PM082_024347 [Marasmius tenuissimus]
MAVGYELRNLIASLPRYARRCMLAALLPSPEDDPSSLGPFPAVRSREMLNVKLPYHHRGSLQSLLLSGRRHNGAKKTHTMLRCHQYPPSQHRCLPLLYQGSFSLRPWKGSGYLGSGVGSGWEYGLVIDTALRVPSQLHSSWKAMIRGVPMFDLPPLKV